MVRIDDPVVTARLLEGRLGEDDRQVEISPASKVTPSARDLLRGRGIEVVPGSGGPAEPLREPDATPRLTGCPSPPGGTGRSRRFSGIFTANIVIYDEHGRIAHGEMERYIAWLIRGRHPRTLPQRQHRRVRAPLQRGAARRGAPHRRGQPGPGAHTGRRQRGQHPGRAPDGRVLRRTSASTPSPWCRPTTTRSPTPASTSTSPRSPGTPPSTSCSTTSPSSPRSCPSTRWRSSSPSSASSAPRTPAATCRASSTPSIACARHRPDYVVLNGCEEILVPSIVMGADGGTTATSGIVPRGHRRALRPHRRRGPGAGEGAPVPAFAPDQPHAARGHLPRGVQDRRRRARLRRRPAADPARAPRSATTCCASSRRSAASSATWAIPCAAPGAVR